MAMTHPEGAYHTYWGDSVAHWEGNTLVVDDTDFNDKTWLGSDGWYHTENMDVVERFTREGNVLHYQATVEDPDVFTRPWVENPRTVLLNHDPNNYVFEDLPCMDFDHNHIVNHDHRPKWGFRHRSVCVYRKLGEPRQTEFKAPTGLRQQGCRVQIPSP